MKTILIADDEAYLRLLMSTTIGCGEYRIVEAADGDQAWAIIQRHRPDVVLLDELMPGRTGLDLTRAIKRDPALRRTPVIVLMAKSQVGDLPAGLEAGADFALTKPFSPLQLLMTVEQALARTEVASRPAAEPITAPAPPESPPTGSPRRAPSPAGSGRA